MRDASRAASGRKVCLLTGAAGILGATFCRRWRHEYDICAVYRGGRLQVPTQEEWFIDPLSPHAALRENDNPVFAVKSNLREPAEVQRVVDLALARFGRIDLVVNAAVHVDRDRLTSLASSSDLLDETFAVNATLPIQLAAIVCRQFWQHSRQDNQAWGRNVINLSSMASLGVVAGVGLSAYSASKAALNMLTAHLAAELAPIGVRANVLAPTSFPQLVPTSLVADTVVDLDRSDLTGCIVQLDENGLRETPSAPSALHF
ncbi:SDR family NAD(P)-dependent oxidoreductase [Leekyejoonella antrihumi]|uniref:SDR family oxidoreductase n=1 Tax=Leekyejoonella antrihumi TaxID=1660198 RepID=A0A563E7P1_9MICO|nr:SDR family oxidoreductase [Leekyejoonella antrihumi]TWP38221.1 SDR family oxidoreductase [Leekyejoonella antrihumi]